MHQVGIPVDVNPSEVIRKHTLGASIDLCLELAGLEPKQVQASLKLDKAQFSRWQSGQEGVVWPKLKMVMNHCGNDAPVMWMAHDCGFDVGSMRRVENELQRENRLLREKVGHLTEVLRGNLI